VDKPKILIQLDADNQASVFDAVVAIDSGADHLLRHSGVKPELVRDLIYGAIFTRGPKDLANTAVFVGGSDLAAAERLFQEATRQLLPQFGLRVSILLDPGGSNTTAAAAVRAAAKHLELGGLPALVLGATGPVGQRVARLLAGQGANVYVGSRELTRATAVCDAILARLPDAKVHPVGTASELRTVIKQVALVVAAGAAGTLLLPKAIRTTCPGLRVAIDLNAVPPAGIEGVEATDDGVERDGAICYGALAIGGAKMKIHKAAVRRLFESNDQILDAEEIYALASQLDEKLV
jgi:hypothetical protein